MIAWVLSIAGMSFLGVIIEVIMPGGKLNGYIKSVFSLILLFVIVAPLPNLVDKNISLNTQYDYSEDGNFLYNLNSKKLENYEIAIIKSLESVGIGGINVQFDADVTKSNLKIEKVYVDVCNIVLNNKDKHININDTIINIVTETIDVEKNGVIIYG